jgi:CRISPR type III-A-associated protein Csm2
MNQNNYGQNRGGFSRSQGGGYNQPAKTITIPDFGDAEFLGKKAQELARDLAKDTGLTRGQLRNFYGEVKNIEHILDAATDQNKNMKWAEVYPRVKLIRAKAVYNANRKQGIKIPDEYKQFLEKGIDKIGQDYPAGFKTFKIFCQLFEAVVGYATEHAKEGK